MKKFARIALVAGLVGMGSVSAATLDLNAINNYVTYGNVNSYSLPILAGIYDELYGGGTGPGSPYYVGSSPGAIKDTLVIYTGANGTDVTTNAAGFDDAYLTPNGKTPSYASIDGAINVDAPAVKAGIANATGDTWDANLANLKLFLNGGDAAFLFNNNDSGEDQHLAVWAKLWVTDGANNLYQNRYLYASADGAIYGDGPIVGGVFQGDASLYNPGDVEPLIDPDPLSRETDYIRSGGKVCLTALWEPVACADPHDHEYNHNLGANQVAYAAMFPVLNGWLNDLFANQSDAALAEYTLHFDLRLGCAPGWEDPDTGTTDCTNISIDNGFEQLFLVAVNEPDEVPEPNTLLLLSLGLLGFVAARRLWGRR